MAEIRIIDALYVDVRLTTEGTDNIQLVFTDNNDGTCIVKISRSQAKWLSKKMKQAAEFAKEVE